MTRMTLTLALPIAAWAQKEAKSKGEITNRTAACKNDRSIAGDGSAGQSVEVRGVPADTRLEAVLRRRWGSVTACTGSTREGGHHSAQRSDSSLVRSSRMGVQSLPISKSRRNSGSRWLAGVVNVQNHSKALPASAAHVHRFRSPRWESYPNRAKWPSISNLEIAGQRSSAILKSISVRFPCRNKANRVRLRPPFCDKEEVS